MSDVSELAGSLAAGVAGGPLSAAGAVVKGINDIIGKFVTDPNQKLAAQQHALDVQAQLQMAALDAQSKDVAASAGANNDHYLGRLRATFGYAMTALYIWNYGIGPATHHATVDIPMNVNVIFGVLMMGFIGVPAGIEMAKQIAAMPGESKASVLGLSVSNKS